MAMSSLRRRHMSPLWLQEQRNRTLTRQAVALMMVLIS